MQQTALARRLARRLTGSALQRELPGFVSRIPSSIMAPFAGEAIDGGNRYRMLPATRTPALPQAFIPARLT